MHDCKSFTGVAKICQVNYEDVYARQTFSRTNKIFFANPSLIFECVSNWLNSIDYR